MSPPVDGPDQEEPRDETVELLSDPEELRDETVEFLSVVGEGEDWVGDTPDWFGAVLFGGFTLGQAVHAATRTAPDGARMHSLHAYFLAPAVAGESLRHRVTPLRDGRSFSSRLVQSTQDERAVFTMTCSFTEDEVGDEYGGRVAAGTPGPDAGPVEIGDGPWEHVYLGPTEPDDDGFMASTHRMWVRPRAPFPDDEHLHAALLAFLTDMTGQGTRPLEMDGPFEGIVSLDHAVWFHRPPAVNDWLLFDAHSSINAARRGLLRGGFYDRSGTLVASMAQETLFRAAGG